MVQQWIYIIGHPLKHTLSPTMQNAAFKKLNLAYQYKAKEIKPQDLNKFVKSIRNEKNCRGFNITIPHKETIIPYLDYVSPEALRIGAVNTVLKINQQLLGFNTDAAGYLKSLTEKVKFNPKNKKIIILGAGGAAKAIAHALANAGAHELLIVNRSKNKANDLQKNLKKFYPNCILANTHLENLRSRNYLTKTDLIINCTSIGLNTTQFENFPFELINKKTFISDIVYKPKITPLLKDAKRYGLKIITGEGMLLHQGALAFEIWTGIPAPLSIMKQTLNKNLV